MKLAAFVAVLGIVAAVAAHLNHDQQRPFPRPAGISNSDADAVTDGPYHPRVDYSLLSPTDDEDDSDSNAWLDTMELHALHVSGEPEERVNLMFFSDGYTAEQHDAFIADAQRLSDVIVAPNGSMAHVAHMLNVYASFVPSESSGLGHDVPLEGSAFGLYRPGRDLRGVYVGHPRRARRACGYWRGQDRGAGCDNAILLGNDPLYGGLGGEFTVITASELNGGLVLRHELGHSLIPVGEEYEGGYVYCGVDADRPENIGHLKWREFLTSDEPVVEDAKVPLQAYPWHDLSDSAYNTSFTSTTTHDHPYPSTFLRLSLSSTPYPSHVNLTLNGTSVDLTPGFSRSWQGTKDRRWVELPLEPLTSGEITLSIELTPRGKAEPAGQGGKMISSVEIIQYGRGFHSDPDYIGAFPTYSEDGKMYLRPTNENCLMRRVNQDNFCPVCKKGLEESLGRIISAKKQGVPHEQIRRSILRCRL